MNSKTQMYVFLGTGLILVLCLGVAVAVFLNGGDPIVPIAGAGSVVAVAVSAAAAKREEASTLVSEARSEGQQTASDVETSRQAAAGKMASIEDEVRQATPDEKEREAESLFGG